MNHPKTLLMIHFEPFKFIFFNIFYIFFIINTKHFILSCALYNIQLLLLELAQFYQHFTNAVCLFFKVNFTDAKGFVWSPQLAKPFLFYYQRHM